MIGAKSALLAKNVFVIWFLWIGPFAFAAALIGLFIDGAGGAAVAGISFGIIGAIVGQKYLINKKPTWRELRDLKVAERKRILDEESGVTAQKSMKRLAEKRICRIEGGVHFKNFGKTWSILVKDGNDGILCNLANNKGSKTIEKLKQKTNGDQADYVRLIGYLCAPGDVFENVKNDTNNYVIEGCEII